MILFWILSARVGVITGEFVIGCLALKTNAPFPKSEALYGFPRREAADRPAADVGVGIKTQKSCPFKRLIFF